MENLLTQINNLKEEINDFSTTDKNPDEIFRIRFIGSNGSVKSLMSEMRNVPPENKKEMGKALNELKLFAEKKYEELKAATDHRPGATKSKIDLHFARRALKSWEPSSHKHCEK